MEPLTITSTEKKDSSTNCNILVYIRVRPTLKSEYEKEIAVNASEQQNAIVVSTRTDVIQAKFDRAFGANSTQYELFETVSHFVPAVLNGFHSTVFAYGQTGSGKTHTMFGSDWENLMGQYRKGAQQTFIQDIENDKLYVGVIPRMINQVFKKLNAPEHAAKRLAVYCSFLQIYNEKIYDLLQDQKTSSALQIRQNKFDGIYVEGLVEYAVYTFEECITLMKRGEKNRYTRQTVQNVKSSRSHTIFQLLVESTIADKNGKLQKAKLNLCDLAGSEKLKKQEDIGYDHLRELKGINLSLSTLGKVIQSLSSKNNLPVPYRDSKLTRLLQDSLGGNTQTCLIAALTPTAECIDETLNTIKFAERARLIVTKVSQNQINATDDQLVQKLKKEIQYLREILSIRRQGGSAIGEVHNKLLILKEENDRLRQNHVSIQEVERLLEENRLMKFELQKLRGEASPTSSTNAKNSESGFAAGQFNFDQMSPSKKIEPVISHQFETSMLDSNTGMKRDYSTKELKSSALGLVTEAVSTKNEAGKLRGMLQSRNTTGRNLYIPSPDTTSKDFGNTDILSVEKFSTSDSNNRSLNFQYKDFKLPDIKKTEMNVRIRGRGQILQTTGLLERTVVEQKKLEEIQKQKVQALDRLRNIQRIQEHSQKMLDLQLNSVSPDKDPCFDKYPATTKSLYRHQSNDIKYNPYQVKREIENKYIDKKRDDFINKQRKKIEDYKVKIQRIHENYLQ